MRFTLFGLAAAAAHVALGVPSQRSFGCGTPEPDAKHVGISKMFATQEADFLAHGGGNLTTRAVINVDLYFHVVAASTSLQDGYVSDSAISAQLGVLNRAYSPHGIQFTHKGTTRTVNAQWASATNNKDMEMKRSLRKGTYKTLNIYILKKMTDEFIGYCYFPEQASPGSTVYIRDGCSVQYDTLPGGTLRNYNLGHIATHEVGHWFGVYHTFQGGCNGEGDSVSDTPAQASASQGCPEGRDSCPNQPGKDPIHNYMDYSYDACYREFTAGQQARMLSFWNNYRANN